MTVSIDKTSSKYHGAMAANYETKRKKQERWDIENAEVEKMLTKLKPKSVLDIPCGTGRYLSVYGKLRVKEVTAVDVSSSMIALAKRKNAEKTKVRFLVKDVRNLKATGFDVSVCVRFLDLIDEAAMLGVIKKLMGVTTGAIICTIRLGDDYIAKSNTATHDQKKFRRVIKRKGWKIVKSVPVFKQGWFILLLKPQ